MAFIPVPNLRQYFVDQNGFPLNGGKIFVYYANTNNSIDTYADYEASALNTNPIILDSAGSADIWIATEQGYDFYVYDRNGVLKEFTKNVYSIKGSPGGGGEKGNDGIKGETGIQGFSGASIKGETGIQGFTGKSGRIVKIFRNVGSFQFIVPNTVNLIDFTIVGGGGGFKFAGSLPANITNLYAGTAGQIKRISYNVTPNEVIGINIGAGGLVNSNESLANGQNCTINIPSQSVTVTVNGGICGSLNDGVKTDFNDEVAPFYVITNETPFRPDTSGIGQALVIIPRAVIGETSPFGSGGNIYTYQNPNAQGNGSSGGSGEITRNSSNIIVSQLGFGTAGIILLEYNV